MLFFLDIYTIFLFLFLEISPIDDEILETNDDSNKSDLLFDLIYYEHKKKIENDYRNVIVEFETHSYLSSILRPYQIDAIKWMLKRERSSRFGNEYKNDKNNELHTLFHKITNKFNETIYYQKYTGL